MFILEYSCGAQAGKYRPLRELAQTVCEIRRHHKEWHIDPEKIAVRGFSAGGHLAAGLGALWNDAELTLPVKSRPDALVLCYPVISTGMFAHEESAEWVSGGDEAVREKLHLLDQITPDFPPNTIYLDRGPMEYLPVRRKLKHRTTCAGRGFPCAKPGLTALSHTHHNNKRKKNGARICQCH